jgi:uncharacterized protein (TIGR00304 family)
MVQANLVIIVGIIAIFIGFVLVFAGTVMQASSNKTSDVKTGGIILIGPIPIIFGSDKGTIVTAVVMAIIIMILAYFLFYRRLNPFN